MFEKRVSLIEGLNCFLGRGGNTALPYTHMLLINGQASLAGLPTRCFSMEAQVTNLAPWARNVETLTSEA